MEGMGSVLFFPGGIINANIDIGDECVLFSTYGENAIGLNLKTLESINCIRAMLDDVEKILIAEQGAETMETSSVHMDYKIIEIGYTNYRGEYSVRRILPIGIWFGSTEYHKEEQWIMHAFDFGKEENRDFAMKDICFMKKTD